jgi:hypothetical protein
MCPAKGVMRLVGFDIVPDHVLPQRVTEVCDIAA